MNRFEDIVGQERAIATLRGTLREGRIPNAYLFEGPWGVGKTKTALALAAALVCRTEGDTACGTCPACVRAARFQHPDIRFLFPVMSDEDDPESIAEVLGEVANDPHHVFTYERSEEHTSELQSQSNLVCRLLLEKKKNVLITSTSLVSS